MKRRIQRKTGLLLTLLLLAGLLTGCGASDMAVTEGFTSSNKAESSMDMEMPKEEMKEELGFENTITEDSAAGSASRAPAGNNGKKPVRSDSWRRNIPPSRRN